MKFGKHIRDIETGVWHQWFAWFPVRISRGEQRGLVVWLENVYRAWNLFSSGGGYWIYAGLRADVDK